MPIATLTPAQERARLFLLGAAQERPTFDADLRWRLRDDLEEALTPVAELLADGPPLKVNKRALARVHSCEQHELTDGDFGWSARTARGTVVHKALERAAFLDEVPPPAELVDRVVEAIAASGDEWTPGTWLRTADPLEIAELKAYATDAVTKIADTFPPVKKQWLPRAESSIAVSLCGDRIGLRGKVDLALGKADGTTARVLLVDFKTGSPRTADLDDLRFYALLETLRVGVPPFRVASFYADAGDWHAEDVTVELLDVAVRRTVDGVRKLAEIRTGAREPAVTPGPTCGWCVLADGCSGAAVWAEHRQD